MLKNLFKNAPALPSTPAEEGLIYAPLETGRNELRDIEKAFARVFSSADGQRVLAHLQVMTFQRALGASSSDQEIRYLEGQRALMASILRLIARGREAP